MTLQTLRPITSKYYRDLRDAGLSPMEIRVEWLSLQTKVDAPNMGVESLISTVIGMALFSIMAHHFMDLNDYNLWIVSPSGKTIAELPFYTAIRVTRKHDWRFADVAPIKPERLTSRWQAFKILFRGDTVNPVKEGK